MHIIQAIAWGGAVAGTLGCSVGVVLAVKGLILKRPAARGQWVLLVVSWASLGLAGLCAFVVAVAG